jgi:hypothetical protein
MSAYISRRFISFISIKTIACIVCVLIASPQARSEVLCNVADPNNPTLSVRESPEGASVSELRNGRVVRVDETKIDSSGRTWAQVSGVFRGDWRNWGWVSKNRLQCVDTDKFPSQSISVKVLRTAGIVSQFASKTLPVSCDEVIEGCGVTISRELYKAYQRRGFSRTSVCLALGGNDVYFDPETGRQLKLYHISGDEELRPIWVPNCFRSVKIVGKGGYLIGWRPTGCSMRYHPSTGLRIRNQKAVELSAGGEKGGGVDEDNRSSTVSARRARALTHGG